MSRVGFTLRTVTVAIFISGVVTQEKFTLITSGTFNGAPVPTAEIQITTPALAPVVTKVPIQKLVCPPNVRIPIFSLPCNTNKDCKVFGPGLACCQDRCIKGVLVPANAVSNRKARITNTIDQGLQTAKSTVLPVELTTTTTTVKPQKVAKLTCPAVEKRVPIFSLPCNIDKDCRIFGKSLICCANRCLEGIVAAEPIQHSPALFGLVERVCPVQPLTEIFEIKECLADTDCTPRICCPERNHKGKSYCRTPIHKIENLPGARQFQQPLQNLVSYMQCTSPPPAELFPKPCQSTLDCFPNLCCQENGKKYCRPPKKSIFNLVADVTTRIGNSEATKKIIQRITT